MAGHKHKLSSGTPSGSPGTRAGRDVTGNSDRPEKKARKQRPCFSCEECRRLKMKCDRQVPCSNCIRRHRLAYCTRATGGTDSPAPTPGRTGRPARHLPSQETETPAPATVAQDRSFLDFQNAFLDGQTGKTNTINDAITVNSVGNAANPSASTGTSTTNTANASISSPTSSSVNAIVSTSANNTANTSVNGGCETNESSKDQDADGNTNEDGNSYGTLVMSHGGRSKYLGPTASEWLKDSHLHDTANTPSVTRCPSPDVEAVQHEQQQPPQHQPPVNMSPIAFPINAQAAQIRTKDLLAHLPPKEEAWALVESYYRYCAWHHDVAPRSRFQETFNRVYSYVTPGKVPPSSAINFQEVALVFVMMSKGTVYNIEMPTDDPSAGEWQHLSEMALVKGNFLSNNTIAGVQTLHIMAHKNFQSDRGRHDDKAWLLWGLAMRMIQAMGLHRDGARWNLPPDIVDERRKVFWEVNAADVFQAHCFSRPSTMNPDHFDTEFPSETKIVPNEKGYFELRFELSQISCEILNMAMKARRPPYSDVIALDLKLRKYDQSLPYYIRCRASLLAKVSHYPSAEQAIADSPEPARRAMTLSFQQSNLALNLCETFINLHRPYYAKALYDDTHTTDTSIYAQSFYAVIERCAMILAIVSDIHSRYPAISTRQWNFWYHVFGSALCLGTLVLKHPQHAMANFVLKQIDTSISLFTSLVENGGKTARYERNLHWLEGLRARAAAKVAKVDRSTDRASAAAATMAAMAMAPTSAPVTNDDRDIDLIGWRTRLIRQADQTTGGAQNFGNGGNVMSNMNSAAMMDAAVTTANTTPTPTIIAGDLPMMTSQVPVQSTDDILREFWDPILLHDLLEGTNDQNDAPLQSMMSSGPSWWEWEYDGSRSMNNM